MTALEDLVSHTKVLFLQYARGEKDEAFSSATLAHAGYLAVCNSSCETAFELSELAEELRLALREAGLNECKQDLAAIDIRIFVMRDEAEAELIKYQWRRILGHSVAQLAKHHFPKLAKKYPHLVQN